jgi:hypothetical protein
LARQRRVPEIFIIAPYYRRLNQLKQAAYRAAKHQGLRPVLAEHDVEAELRWRRIAAHIGRARYVIAVFAAAGRTGAGSQNISLEIGYAFARKPSRRIGLFCHRTHRANPLCFPTNLNGFDPIQFRSAADLEAQIRRWIVRSCPDRNEPAGQEAALIDAIAAAVVAKGIPEEQARREAERDVRIVKAGSRPVAEFSAEEVKRRVGPQPRRRRP